MRSVTRRGIDITPLLVGNMHDTHIPLELASEAGRLGEATKLLRQFDALLSEIGAVREPEKRLDRCPSPVPGFPNYHNPALHVSTFAPRPSSCSDSR
jgi:hypothetical protein